MDAMCDEPKNAPVRLIRAICEIRVQVAMSLWGLLQPSCPLWFKNQPLREPSATQKADQTPAYSGEADVDVNPTWYAGKEFDATRKTALIVIVATGPESLNHNGHKDRQRSHQEHRIS